MIITKLMTNKGDFDTNDSLEKVLESIKVAKDKGELLKLDRGEIDSLYQSNKCKDKQHVYLDLSVVDIFGYSTHDIIITE